MASVSVARDLWLVVLNRRWVLVLAGSFNGVEAG